MPPTAAVADLSPGSYVLDGAVYSLARSGDSLFVGGAFTSQRAKTGGGLVTDGSGNGHPDPSSFPQVAGSVAAVTDDGVGGWFIGGKFTAVDGEPRSGLAHIKADGTLDPSWNPGAVAGTTPNATVAVLVRSGATLYAGGDFSSIGGTARNDLAAIDTGSGAVKPWNPGGPGSSDAVADIAVEGSTVFVAGTFTEFGGAARNGFAAVSAASGSLLSWNPGSNSAHGYAVSVLGSTVYVAGDFTSIGGESRPSVAALSATTATATSWNAQAGSADDVTDILATATAIYVGGRFTSMGGQSRGGLAALDPSTGSATSWNPNVNGAFGMRLALSGSTLFLVGQFETVGGQSRRGTAAVDATTGALKSWNPQPTGGLVNTVAAAGGNVYVGGDFYGAGPAIGSVRGLARVLSDGTLDTDWNANPTQPTQPWNPEGVANVAALIADGSTLYAAGTFTTIGGQARGGLAALNTGTGSVTSWNPNATTGALGGGGEALALSGSTLYVAGSFASIGGQTNRTLVALNTTTGALSAWNPGALVTGLAPTYPRYSLAVAGDTVFIGGNFSSIGGSARQGMAAVDATTGAVKPWNPAQTLNREATIYGPVTNSLLSSGSKLYVSGGFDAIGGQSRAGFAALDTTSALALAWNPAVDFSSIQGRVIGLRGSTVYVGGPFASVGGTTHRGFAAVDATTGQLLPGSPRLSSGGTARAVQAIGSRLYLAGDFSSIDGKVTGPLGSVALADPEPPAPATPANTSPPTISGDAQIGSGLSCTPGAWTGSPALSYQWLRSGNPIPGANGAAYGLTEADAGQNIACRVTATNSAGSASATSAALSVSEAPKRPEIHTECSCPPPKPPTPPFTGADTFKLEAPRTLSRARLKRGFKIKLSGLKPGSPVTSELRSGKRLLQRRRTKASTAGNVTITFKPKAKTLRGLKRGTTLLVNVRAVQADGSRKPATGKLRLS